MRNTNDGTNRKPYLRICLNLGTLTSLPTSSTGPRGSEEQMLSAIAAAGYEGIQAGPEMVAAARRYKLGISTSGRVDKLSDAVTLAKQMKDAGTDACTLHVGSGFESEAEADALLSAIIDASIKHEFPLYVETHRATLTQDCWRTLRLVERHPLLKINGDFSHWYTGLEMVYGDFAWKLNALKPVFDRVRFMHGRIGNPGSMQVDVGNGSSEGRPFVDHFRQIWIRCFAGFLASARAGDYICFAPELLHPEIYYARMFDGKEESDRWQQALVLAGIARECFAAAAAPAAR